MDDLRRPPWTGTSRGLHEDGSMPRAKLVVHTSVAASTPTPSLSCMSFGYCDGFVLLHSSRAAVGARCWARTARAERAASGTDADVRRARPEQGQLHRARTIPARCARPASPPSPREPRRAARDPPRTEPRADAQARRLGGAGATSGLARDRRAAARPGPRRRASRSTILVRRLRGGVPGEPGPGGATGATRRRSPNVRKHGAGAPTERARPPRGATWLGGCRVRDPRSSRPSATSRATAPAAPGLRARVPTPRRRTAREPLPGPHPRASRYPAACRLTSRVQRRAAAPTPAHGSAYRQSLERLQQGETSHTSSLAEPDWEAIARDPHP